MKGDDSSVKNDLLLNLKGKKLEELRDSSWNADCREAEDTVATGFLAAKISSCFLLQSVEENAAHGG